MNPWIFKKGFRFLKKKAEATIGAAFFDLDETLGRMARRPFELHLEFTNVCNAKCIFCAYPYITTKPGFMSDEVFSKAVSDFIAIQGGSVCLTPPLGDALIHPKFLERVRWLRSLGEIDRIFLTTNAVLVDKFGAVEILKSGITSMNISLPGFSEASYAKIFGTSAYRRVMNNVRDLLKENRALGSPVNLWLCVRSDRNLKEVLADPDFAELAPYKPNIDFTSGFHFVGNLVPKDAVLPGMRVRPSVKKVEPCANLFNGPLIRHDGSVIACSCFGAPKVFEDLKIGNILEESLAEIYSSNRLTSIRKQFGVNGGLNETCQICGAYQNLDLYRVAEGRKRAQLNLLRANGSRVFRGEKPKTPFSGG